MFSLLIIVSVAEIIFLIMKENFIINTWNLISVQISVQTLLVYSSLPSSHSHYFLFQLYLCNSFCWWEACSRFLVHILFIYLYWYFCKNPSLPICLLYFLYSILNYFKSIFNGHIFQEFKGFDGSFKKLKIVHMALIPD